MKGEFKIKKPKSKHRVNQNKTEYHTAVEITTQLAQCPVNDCVLLALKGSQMSKEEILRLNLLPLAFLGRDKSGEIEVKLHDRLRALEMLIAHEDKANDEGILPLYYAIKSSANSDANHEVSDLPNKIPSGELGELGELNEI